MNNKLYVGNLSFNTTENDLHDAFAAHGQVVEANLMVDRESGRPRGFGFVTMSTAEEAQKAIAAMNGASLDGRPLTTLDAFTRYGGYAAGLATGLIGFARVLWEPNRQAIEDKIAWTVVVRGR